MTACSSSDGAKVEKKQTEKKQEKSTQIDQTEESKKIASIDTLYAAAVKMDEKKYYEKYFNWSLTYYIENHGYDKGKIKTISYYSKMEKQGIKAYVYLPAGYTEKKEYPVIYMLHGFNGALQRRSGRYGRRCTKAVS